MKCIFADYFCSSPLLETGLGQIQNFKCCSSSPLVSKANASSIKEEHVIRSIFLCPRIRVNLLILFIDLIKTTLALCFIKTEIKPSQSWAFSKR